MLIQFLRRLWYESGCMSQVFAQETRHAVPRCVCCFHVVCHANQTQAACCFSIAVSKTATFVEGVGTTQAVWAKQPCVASSSNDVACRKRVRAGFRSRNSCLVSLTVAVHALLTAKFVLVVPPVSSCMVAVARFVLSQVRMTPCFCPGAKF